MAPNLFQDDGWADSHEAKAFIVFKGLVVLCMWLRNGLDVL